jgi:hypothetical protein
MALTVTSGVKEAEEAWVELRARAAEEEAARAEAALVRSELQQATAQHELLRAALEEAEDQVRSSALAAAAAESRSAATKATAALEAADMKAATAALTIRFEAELTAARQASGAAVAAERNAYAQCSRDIAEMKRAHEGELRMVHGVAMKLVGSGQLLDHHKGAGASHERTMSTAKVEAQAVQMHVASTTPAADDTRPRSMHESVHEMHACLEASAAQQHQLAEALSHARSEVSPLQHPSTSLSWCGALCWDQHEAAKK